LFCPEATITPAHRAALEALADDATVLTNVFSGRPARGIANRLVREVGPISTVAPAFPNAGPAVAPLKAKPDLAQMWSGQAAALAKRGLDAAALTRWLTSS
jgi:nitronate monooxygenase